jgi:hypothetical protein
MGRTTLTATNFMDLAEHGVFGGFMKNLTPAEKRVVRQLFTMARQHITAISMAGHILIFETVLMAMMLEQRRQLEEIGKQIETARR